MKRVGDYKHEGFAKSIPQFCSSDDLEGNKESYRMVQILYMGVCTDTYINFPGQKLMRKFYVMT